MRHPTGREVHHRELLSPPGPPPEIVGADGRLSASESRNVLAGIKRRVESTGILERHTAVMELVGATPLVKDNKATILIDEIRTYDAMFQSIANARDNIHFETFIIRDDEIGHMLGDMLLRKQYEGVPVHLIYDSVGSVNTPESFFVRLRDGGIRVLEINPVDPLKAGKKWRLINRDHRVVGSTLGVGNRLTYIMRCFRLPACAPLHSPHERLFRAGQADDRSPDRRSEARSRREDRSAGRLRSPTRFLSGVFAE